MTTPLSGWGRSTWNNATWNQGGTVDATGVTLTSSVNDVGLVLDIIVTQLEFQLLHLLNYKLERMEPRVKRR